MKLKPLRFTAWVIRFQGGYPTAWFRSLTQAKAHAWGSDVIVKCAVTEIKPKRNAKRAPTKKRRSGGI